MGHGSHLLLFTPPPASGLLPPAAAFPSLPILCLGLFVHPDMEPRGSHLTSRVSHRESLPGQHPTLEPCVLVLQQWSGAGRAGRSAGVSFYPYSPNLIIPRVLEDRHLPPHDASINPPTHRWKCPRACVGASVSSRLWSPQAWSTAPFVTVSVLLRKASPAIMFYSHFLHLCGQHEVGSVTRAWTLY